MIVEAGTPQYILVYGTFPKTATPSVEFTNASNVVQNLNIGRVGGSFAEFFLSEALMAAENLPATAKFKVDNNVVREVVFEEQPADPTELAVQDLEVALAEVEEELDTKESKMTLAGLPIYSYGASYSTLNQAYHTAGQHYLQQVSSRYGGGAVTSYGVNGRRALDIANHLLSGVGMSGVNSVVAGAIWPGVSLRNGLVVHDALGNDIMNQAAMNGGSIIVAAISGTNYINYLKQQYRTALALMSTESKIDNHSHTTTSGAGWQHSTAGTWASGGTTCYTTANGDYAEYSVVPPQSGPMAGKVFVVLDGDIPTASVFSDVNVSVDGGSATLHTTYRHNYIGQNGTQIKGSINSIPVTLPVDGNAHTIRIAHAGTAGHFMIIDCILIPSSSPNIIACMGVEHNLTTHASGFDSGDLAIYKGNSVQVHAAYKSVVSEFPHAIYVPSTMTLNGLWSADGIHPNDRGMQQRANDLTQALETASARNKNRLLSSMADSNFAIV